MQLIHNRVPYNNLLLMHIFLIFTARRYANAVYAVAPCLSVCPSACLSVTSQSSTKIAKHRMTQWTAYDNPKNIGLVFLNFNGITQTGAKYR